MMYGDFAEYAAEIAGEHPAQGQKSTTGSTNGYGINNEAGL